LIGKISKYYPLRSKFLKIIQKGKIQGSKVYDFPGYFDILEDKIIKERKINELYCSRQNLQYIRALQNSKIVICTKSIRNYSVRKYIEAAMAGCLIIGNLPLERRKIFKKFVVEVKSNESKDYLVKTVNWWIKNNDLRIERAKIGQMIVLKKFLSVNQGMLMLKYMKKFLKGKRGISFRFPFNLKI
jgi:hypothetical protein